MFSILRKRKVDDLDEILSDVLGDFELPSFPVNVMKVLSALRDPDATINVIGGLLQRDPGMSVQVLRVVNSAAFGVTTPVTNLAHAASLLGRARLESLLVAVAVRGALPAASIKGLDMQQFWATAARRASLARSMADRLHSHSRVEAFTGGMLLDMGVPIFTMCKRADYVEVYNAWKSDPDAELSDLETEMFGYDHCAVGAIAARKWDLPKYLVNAILDHHDWDDDSEIDPAIKIVGLIRDDNNEEPPEKILAMAEEEHQISRAEMADIVLQAYADAKEFTSAMSG